MYYDTLELALPGEASAFLFRAGYPHGCTHSFLMSSEVQEESFSKSTIRVVRATLSNLLAMSQVQGGHLRSRTSSMAMQPRRFEKRTAAAVAVMLISPDLALPTELTITEDISGRGARVVTKGLWRPNDSLVIKSLEGDLQSEARLVYRQAIRKDTYAVGLELVPPTGNWRGE